MDFLDILRRHNRIALSFSGGKDSLACVYMMRPLLELITIYHLDTGDLLPEVREVVDHVEAFAPRFVRVQTDVLAWQREHGLPTDLLPHSAHDFGQRMAEGPRLVQRYECCGANLIWPLFNRMRDDGVTCIIRGTKAVDMARLPAASGAVHDGIELLLPIQHWTNDQVFAYLREAGAPISRIYEHVTNSPECARCSAWWGEKRAAYLRQYHPKLFAEYADRLRVVSDAIQGSVDNLRHEMDCVA